MNTNHGVIRGTYCSFEWSNTERNFTTEIMPVGSNVETATDREKIAYFISVYLPSRSYLEMVENIEQAKYWTESKDHFTRVALCFLSEIDNPLRRELEEGQISQATHDITWLSSKSCENLWTLVSMRWEPIKECLQLFYEKCPFSQPRDLIEAILAEWVDPVYLKCFRPFYQVNVKQLRDLATLNRKVLKGQELSKAQATKLIKLREQHRHTNLWLERTMAVCQLGAKVDPFIETHLKIDEILHEGILKIEQKIMCCSSSTTWVNGERRSGLYSLRQLERELYKS